MKVVLYDWPASPFCMKVRALLDYKSIDYDRINILSSAWFEVRRRGKIGKVPALEIDGDLVCDSTDIAYKIEELTPNPPIIPADPYQAALCHALEDWASRPSSQTATSLLKTDRRCATSPCWVSFTT
jgi:glutathione S-transferase